MITAYDREANKYLKDYPIIWSTTMDGLSYKPLNYLVHLIKTLALPLEILPEKKMLLKKFLDFNLRHFKHKPASTTYIFNQSLDELKSFITKQQTQDAGKFIDTIVRVNQDQSYYNSSDIRSYLRQIDGIPTRNGLIRVDYFLS